MSFKFHPPTRSECSICETLLHHNAKPLIDSSKGKASSANDFLIHNWYNFVLGYSPDFPDYIIKRERISGVDLVIDPFMGSGTTLVCCKLKGIPSKGIDANDFMVDAARVKLLWDLDTKILRKLRDELLRNISANLDKFVWDTPSPLVPGKQVSLWCNSDNNKIPFEQYAKQHRTEMIPARYISDKPFAKAKIIQETIQKTVDIGPEQNFFSLALSSILVSISNVRYGPGFGVITPKEDFDVYTIFLTKVNRMINDLSVISSTVKSIPSDVVLGDTRNLTQHFGVDSASFMITSPPYPGDHEYTKHTRLELVFEGKATDINEFKKIKRRMLQASTTNMYHDLTDRDCISNMESIKSVTNLIQERLDHDNATSGFEKLYTRLVRDYFGGMHKSLGQCLKVLKPGGKIALLVSDSHAFKMVHIQTAEILKEIGVNLGFVNPEIILWQFKPTTSNKIDLRENILLLTKPN